MPKENIDRRVQKTRQLLKDAMISLIIEKGFEAVTISDLLDRANVGRSTFYIHYENKYELLHSCFGDFHDLFEKHTTGTLLNKKNSRDMNRNGFTLSLFQLVEQNKRLFKAFLGKDSIPMFSHPLHNYIYTYIKETLNQSVLAKKQTPLQLEMLTHYLTGSFVSLLTWWVYKDVPYPAEEIDKYFKQFTMYDLRNLTDLELK